MKRPFDGRTSRGIVHGTHARVTGASTRRRIAMWHSASAARALIDGALARHWL